MRHTTRSQSDTDLSDSHSWLAGELVLLAGVGCLTNVAPLKRAQRIPRVLRRRHPIRCNPVIRRSRGKLGDYAGLSRLGDGLVAVVCVEFAEDRRHVMIHGPC